MAAKKKSLPSIDYVALEALTGPEFVEKIKSECDSESYGSLNTIERFNISYPIVDSDFRYYRVDVLSRSRYLKFNHIGNLSCHYFAIDLDEPNKISHVELNYFLVERFHKLCKGFKEND